MARPKGGHNFNWRKHPEIEARLREIYRGRLSKETAEMLNAEFGTNFTGIQIAKHLANHGLRNGLGKNHNKGVPSFWTPEKKAFVEARLDKPYAVVLDEFEKEFGVRITWGALGHFKWRNGLYSENDGRYKPGSLPANHSEVGAEADKGNGYLWVKVSGERHTGNGSRKNWKPKHTVEWEKEHGPLPEGMIVTFRDGDRRNFSQDNLMAVTRTELNIMTKLGVKGMEPEARETGELVCRLRASITERRRKHDEHK